MRDRAFTTATIRSRADEHCIADVVGIAFALIVDGNSGREHVGTLTVRALLARQFRWRRLHDPRLR